MCTPIKAQRTAQWNAINVKHQHPTSKEPLSNFQRVVQRYGVIGTLPQNSGLTGEGDILSGVQQKSGKGSGAAMATVLAPQNLHRRAPLAPFRGGISTRRCTRRYMRMKARRLQGYVMGRRADPRKCKCPVVAGSGTPAALTSFTATAQVGRPTPLAGPVATVLKQSARPPTTQP
jgi:hypothetical protein